MASTMRQPIDWRKISKINADQILRENDLDALEHYLEMVTYADVDGISDVDPCVATLLKLSQGMTIYTIQSQEQLRAYINQLETENLQLKNDNTQLKTGQESHDEYVRKLKLDNRKRRKIIEDLQKRIDLGANAYYSCAYCSKNFINATFLQGHLARKHPDQVGYVGDAIAHAQKVVNEVNTNLDVERKENEKRHSEQKLQLEVEEKKRMSEISGLKADIENNNRVQREEMMDTIRKLNAQLDEKEALSQEKNQAHDDEANILKTELVRMKEEMENYRKMMEDVKNRKTYVQAVNQSNDLPMITPRIASNHSTPGNSYSEPKPVSRSVSREISPERQNPQQQVHKPVQLPDVQKHVPQAPIPENSQIPQNIVPQIPVISREECINELERRMQVLGLDLGMSKLTDEEYKNKLGMYQNQRQQMWTGIGMYETKQYLANELESQVSLRSRHNSNYSMGSGVGNNGGGSYNLGGSSMGINPLGESPMRTKSLSQPNVNVQGSVGNDLSNTPSGILKGSAKSLAPSRVTLPTSQPSGLNINLPPSGGANTSVKRKLCSSFFSLTPRESVSEEQDESTAWDESQSKIQTQSIQSKKSVTIVEEKSELPEESEEATEPTQPTPVLANNRSNDDGEESEDDWMDDLDEALAKQGYGGL